MIDPGRILFAISGAQRVSVRVVCGLCVWLTRVAGSVCVNSARMTGWRPGAQIAMSVHRRRDKI